MYYLQNNVEIVSGAKQHCIYNLNAPCKYLLNCFRNVPSVLRAGIVQVLAHIIGKYIAKAK